MSTQLTVSTEPRVSELLDWQLITGRPLPLPVETIIDFENAGCIVDLDAGCIYGSEQAWLDHVATLVGEVTP